jgi:hypothetical protein
MEAQGWYIQTWVEKTIRRQNQNGIPVPMYLARLLQTWRDILRPELKKKGAVVESMFLNQNGKAIRI